MDIINLENFIDKLDLIEYEENNNPTETDLLLYLVSNEKKDGVLFTEVVSKTIKKTYKNIKINLGIHNLRDILISISIKEPKYKYQYKFEANCRELIDIKCPILRRELMYYELYVKIEFEKDLTEDYTFDIELKHILLQNEICEILRKKEIKNNSGLIIKDCEIIMPKHNYNLIDDDNKNDL